MAGSKFYGKKKREIIEEEELGKLLDAATADESAKVEESKDEEVKPTEVINQSVQPTSLKLHRAHNLYRNKTTKKYMLVTIEYDLASGYSKIVSEEPVADDIGVGLMKIENIFRLKVFRQEEDT
jgi:hypothetical protein